MLFLHQNFSKAIAFGFLFILFSFHGIALGNVNSNDNFKSRILEANQELAATNFEINVYRIASVILVCILFTYLYLEHRRLKKRLIAKNQSLLDKLILSQTKNKLLLQNGNVIKQFYTVLRKRIDQILNNLTEIRAALPANQKKLNIKLNDITDFTESVSRNFDRTVKLFNSLE